MEESQQLSPTPRRISRRTYPPRPRLAPSRAKPRGVGNDSEGYCSVLVSSGVDCWGKGGQGQLGTGVIRRPGSAKPVAVAAVGGTGILAGVTTLVGHDGSYCALLEGGGVDCWGLGGDGQLGNGR